MLDLLAKEVDIQRCKAGFHFLGQRDLVLELLQKHDCQWQLFKERLFYLCKEVSPATPKTKAVVENASFEDIHQLVEMTVAFDENEYPDKPSRDWDKALAQVAYGMKTNRMFVAKSAGTICSMLQVIHTEGYDHPIFGSLYTLPQLRNHGYASLLLRKVTGGLLNAGYEDCGLLSDITNPASNKAFVNVGYRPIYHWADVIMA